MSQGARLRSYLSRVLIASLMGTLMLASPAVGEETLDPRTTPPDQRPVRSPAVSARAAPRGVEISWDHAPVNAASFEIFRSTNAGQAENITPAGVRGHRYLDLTAAVNTAYTYSVKVKSVNPEPEFGRNEDGVQSAESRSVRASAGQELGSADIHTPASFESGQTRAQAARDRAAAISAEARNASRAERYRSLRNLTVRQTGKPASASSVGPRAHIGASCQVSGDIVTATVWSPASCPSGYLLTGDVVVTATAAVTVDPGTTVYFSTSTVTDTVLPAGVAGKVDLIVFDGSLDVNGVGEGTSRVTFTSTGVDDTDGDVTPTVGDWGWVAFSPSSAPSSIEGADFAYGSTILLHEVTWPISNTTMEKMDGEPITGAGYNVLYLDPPAGSPVVVDDLTVDAEPGSAGLFVLQTQGDVNGIVASVSNSTLESETAADSALCFVDVSEDSAASIDADVTNVTMTSSASAPGLIYFAIEADATTTAVGSASITGFVSNSRIDSTTGGSVGFLGEAVATDGPASHTIGFSGNNFEAESDASINIAIAGGSGDAVLDYPVSSGSYFSSDGTGWLDVAISGDGDAHAHPFFSDVRLESQSGSSSDWGLLVEAIAVTGTAQASPALTNGSRIGGANGGLALGISTLDDAITHPVLTDSTVDTYAYEGFWSEAISVTGSATADATVTNSRISSALDGFYAIAISSGVTGTFAEASPEVSGSEIGINAGSGGDGAVVAYAVHTATNTSSANADPTITNSQITNSDSLGGYGLWTWASTGGDGDASTSPSIDGTTIFSDGYEAALTEAYSLGDGNASALPSVTGSNLRSTYYEALQADAYALGDGSGLSQPTVSGSNLTDIDDDDGVELNAGSVGGLAHIGGAFTDSSIRGWDDAVDVYAAGADATVDPSFTNSNLFSPDDGGLVGTSDGTAGTSTNSPTFSGGSINGFGDWVLELYAYGKGSPGDLVEVSPSVDGVTMRGYGGIYLYADDTDGTPHGSQSHTGGSITNNRLSSDWDDGIAAYTYSTFSTATVASMGDLEVVGNVIEAYDDAVKTLVYSDGAEPGTGLENHALVRSNSITSWWNDGVELRSFVYSPTATAVDTSEVRLNQVRSTINGVDWFTYNGDTDGETTIVPTIIDNTFGPFQASDGGDGIETGAYAGAVATHEGVIAGNSISGKGTDGINPYVGVIAKDENLDVLISGNTVQDVGTEGIEVETGGSTGPGDVARIVDNVVANTGQSGIRVVGAIADVRSNVQSNSGVGSSGAEDSSGIVVRDAAVSTPAGRVACNTVSGNDNGVFYLDNPGGLDPVTTQNNFADVVSGAENVKDVETNNSATTTATENYFGAATNVNNSATGTVDASSPLTDLACRGGYMLDGYGGVHRYGGAPVVTTTAVYTAGVDNFRGIATKANASNSSSGQSGYIVDGFGDVTLFGPTAAPSGEPTFGFDIARDIVLLPDATGGYILDGFGGVHPFGIGGGPLPPLATGLPYFPGFDIARRLVLRPDGQSGYILDGWGGVHPFGTSDGPVPPLATSLPYFPGFDIARDLILLHSGHGGYLLDGYGGMHPFGSALGSPPPLMTDLPYFAGFDIARAITEYVDGSAFMLDGFAGVHAARSFPASLTPPAFDAPYFGFDIARDIDGRM